MFTLPRLSRSTRPTSPATHFAHCISRAKTTARGFWAWIPTMSIDLPVTRLSVQTPATSDAGASNYCEAIVAAAARVHSAT